jgi:hypothetical protein
VTVKNDLKAGEAERQLEQANTALSKRASEVGALKARLSVVEKERDKLLQQVSLIERVSTTAVERPEWATPSRKKSEDHRATLCLLVTDTHFDENVDPDEVDGINCYTREIAEQRLQRCFERALRLARQYLGGVKYDGVELMLGGDIFSGNIHEELKTTNADTLFGSLLHWIGPMVAGVGVLADEFKHVHVSGVPGNHGRMTRKPVAKQRAADNLDWLLYNLMAREMKSDARVTWNISKAADAHIQIYTMKYLLTHGDQFRGGSGISGALCLGPDTRVLGTDLRYRSISSLSIGDQLVGFDEHGGPTTRRRFRPTTVESLDRITRPSIELMTSTGTVLASEEHMWLTRPVWGGVGASLKWKATRDLGLGDLILTLGQTWTPDESWEAGWLAGMYDGEGYVSGGRLGVAQSFTHNPDLVVRIKNALTARGYAWSEAKGKKGCSQFRHGNDHEKRMLADLRLLGTLRPARMIAQSASIWTNTACNAANVAEVIGLRRVGPQEVITIGTSSRTLIAEGLLSHNSPLMLGTHRKNQRQSAAGKPYDVMVMGHWHQNISLPSRGLLVGGCLKGYDEYSYISNFPPEPPQQALWITTPEHGITFQAPVFVQVRKAEGW